MNGGYGADYIYANRSFTEKGHNNRGMEFDCSYKKGWNIRNYLSLGNNGKCTTQPIEEELKWHFAELFISSCDKEDSSTFNNPDKFRLVKVLTYSNSSASDLVGERVYTYDKTGNMIKESFYDRIHSTKTLLYYREYEYSGNKKVKEKFFGGVAGSFKLYKLHY